MAATPESRASGPRVERLTRELAAVTEQQTATSHVLEAIGRSPSDLAPVLETVVRHAMRLCSADAGLAYQLEGDVYMPVMVLGGSKAYRSLLRKHPVAQGTGTLVGLVGAERRTMQMADAQTDPRYQWQEARDLGGFRTGLGVPMLTEQRVVGVLALWRARIDPFDDRTVGVVTTFAAQGAIAIQNVHLLHELEQRGAELARSVDELRALGEVSQAVSSSLDLDEVLTTIVTRAAELSKADGASIFEFDKADGRFALRTCFGTGDELIQSLRAIPMHLGDTFVGRATISREPRQSPDIDREQPDPHLDALRRHGWRSLAALPLLREDEIVGVLVVRRRVTGALPEQTVDLLETLASQSAVAIHNARVFQELEEKTRLLEVASAHKSDFLASMSHELRTPLNAVIGFSDVLLESMFGDLNDRQREYVVDIRDSGRHLLELINEILDLSKVEAGRMELDLARVPLADLLEQCAAMVRERAERHGISLRLDIPPDLGVVEADELKLKQVVLNLLSNAVKFTPDSGSVTLTARRAGGEAHVSVRDTGVGIAEADRDRIFEAFQRGDRASRTATEGTGLGLTLSKRIIDLHDGRLWMESRLGVGSTFSFAIPVEPQADQADQVVGRGPNADARAVPSHDVQEMVVVVEDDRRSADLLVVYLEGAGYAVSVANDGIDGLDRIGRLRPAAVILDVLLPGMNGWDLLAELKKDPATAAIPVLIVSMLDERGTGFALGAAEYLVKPIEREPLLAALARCASAPAAPPTVVVIDDDPRDLDLLEAVLGPQGWSVVRATGGQEGVALVERERPAAVVLDLLMPDVDGFAVVEQLRANASVADVPIVVLTAKDMTASDSDRLAGQISFLAQKGTFSPMQLVDLLARVARVPVGPGEAA